MMARQKCTATKRDGTPCRSFARPETGLCVAHDPAQRESQKAASRAGGEARANARRAVRDWVMIGGQVAPEDLPAMLRGSMLAVRDGSLEPAKATAIAGLAKASLQLQQDLELQDRVEELERILSEPAPLRRIS